jgi:hypothetical protein
MEANKMNSPYLTRFAELYAHQGRRVEIMDDKFWVSYDRMIVPIGPIITDYSISDDHAHRLLKKFPGALMVRYTDGSLRPNGGEDWYAVICDSFKELGAYRHESKREIKRGLENCEVRQVDAGFIADYGYEVYASAFSRYQNVIKPMGKNDFIKLVGATQNFDDIYDYWAVFYRNKLIAYSLVAIYGGEEAAISVVKCIPEYFKFYPYNALFYSMTKYYLQYKSLHYLNAGFKSIYHNTNMHEYLIKRLSFKKVYLNLGIIYHRLFSYFIKLTYPFRGTLSKSSHKLKTLYMLEDIRKKCNHVMIQ